MKKIITSAVLFTVFLTLGVFSSCKKDDPDPPKFSDETILAIDQAITNAMDGNFIPGAIVGIWIPDEGYYVKEFGVGDTTTNDAMLMDNHFRIGSCTKMFVGLVTLQLVQEGLISIHDPIGDYVDDFFIPAKDEISIKNLCRMTSGIPSYTWLDELQEAIFTDPYHTPTARQFSELVCSFDTLMFQPGTSWQYSNTNTVLTALMIENVTGKSIQQNIKERILSPLNMNNTIYPESAEMPIPYSHGYTDYTPDVSITDCSLWDPSWAGAAGKMISTMDDLKVFIEAVGSGQLLSTEMIALQLDGYHVGGDRYYGINIGMDHGWIGHSGDIFGYTSSTFFMPEKNATAVILTNSSVPCTNGNSPSSYIFNAVAKIVTPDNVPYQ